MLRPARDADRLACVARLTVQVPVAAAEGSRVDRIGSRKVEVATMSHIANLSPLNPVSYEPGVCNIGPAEIARRRRAGHIGLAATVILFVGLVALGLPHWTRLVLVLTAGMSATGYLQAALHFCAGFGAAGVYNFGELGTTEHVTDPHARARDRMRSLQIGLASLAIGLAVGIGAALLPIG